MKSWKTTTFGLMAALGGAAITLDGLPHWLTVAAKLAATLGLAGLGWAARDNDKCSEQVGAAKPTDVAVKVLPLLILIPALALVDAGCASSAQKVMYDTESTAAVTADAAMTAWGDYVNQFQPSLTQQLKVKALYEKYQAAELATIDASTVYVALAASGDTNSIAAKLKTTACVQAEANALGDLVAVIRALTGGKF